MQQLTGADALFLFLETPEMPMHVGALHVLELPARYRGRFVVELRRHIRRCLPLLPVLCRRLWWMPLNLANPAWVDADPDLDAHIVEVELAPGSDRDELEAAVSRLHPVLLDRSRPLWKMHVLEGLAASETGRRRVALYTQLHQAAVDGRAAVAVARALFDLAPRPRVAARKSSRRTSGTFQLGVSEMLRGALASEAQQVSQLVRALPSTVGMVGGALARIPGIVSLLGRKTGAAAQRGSAVGFAPRTPLNVTVGRGRAFACVSVPLPALQALAQSQAATLDDLVLMLVGTALRRFYGKRRRLPRASMVAAVPAGRRTIAEAHADGAASMRLVSLGTHIADPLRRLAHVKAANAALKSTEQGLKGLLPADFPSLGVPWLMEAAAALYGRAKVADRIPQVANLVISSLPATATPLYLAGARMTANYPASIVVHGLGLNVTVQSYDQSLDFGLTADAKAMPDVRELADSLLIAVDELLLTLSSLTGEDEGTQWASALELARRQLGASLTEAASAALGNVVGIAGIAVGKAVSPALKRAARQAIPRVARAMVDEVIAQAVSQAKRDLGKVEPAKRGVRRASRR
jgi:diacylglycerol O-acyltransferase / wax synthase